MKKGITALAASLGLLAVLALADSGLAQQDTTQATRSMRARRGAHAGMMGQRGMGRAGFRGAGHLGPHMLLRFKEELELSESQVEQLEQLGADHQALMEAQRERLDEHREAMQKARTERDYDALERLIGEGAQLHSEIARGLLNVERGSLDVLTDAQREKFETWREGARVFGRQRLEGWREMRGQGMRGRDMRQRQRIRRPPPPPPES